MNARILGAVAFAAACLAAPAASAVPYHIVYDATITDGSDADNIFGLANTNIVGLGLRADVTFLTSVPGTRTTTATYDEVTGGDAFPTDPVISSAVFTIAGRSFTMFPTYYGDVYASRGEIDAFGYDTLFNSFQTYILPNRAGPTNLQTLFSSSGTGDTGGRITQYSNLLIGNDVIDFDATGVTVSAVPEAATWTTMLVGVGVIGGALRRRGAIGGTLRRRKARTQTRTALA